MVDNITDFEKIADQSVRFKDVTLEHAYETGAIFTVVVDLRYGGWEHVIEGHRGEVLHSEKMDGYEPKRNVRATVRIPKWQVEDKQDSVSSFGKRP